MLKEEEEKEKTWTRNKYQVTMTEKSSPKFNTQKSFLYV